MTTVLLQQLSRPRFHVSLVLMRRAGEFVADVPPDVELTSLGRSSSWFAWYPLARRLRQSRPDVVVSTSSGGSLVLSLAHLIAHSRARLVVSERNVVYHGERTLKRRAIVAAKRLLFRRADLVTCISEGLRRDVIEQLDVPTERVVVVYNPVVTSDIERLGAEPMPLPDPREDGVPVVLGAGRLVAQKDFTTLIRAFAAVRQVRPARLVILGDGPMRRALGELAATLGVAGDVTMPGFTKNPYRYMARCTAFVLSSRHEGLGNVLIEAMACGAPVIATDCPCGPSEIITRDGNDGFLVDVGNHAAIAERLVRLLDDAELRRRMGEAGRRSAQRFRADVIAKRYEAAILGEPLPDGLDATSGEGP